MSTPPTTGFPLSVIVKGTRDGEAGVLSVHTTFEGARQGVIEWVERHHDGFPKEAYQAYHCDITKGDFSDEETSLTIVSRPLLP